MVKLPPQKSYKVIIPFSKQNSTKTPGDPKKTDDFHTFFCYNITVLNKRLKVISGWPCAFESGTKGTDQPRSGFPYAHPRR